MQYFYKILKSFLTPYKKPESKGPNSLEELLTQFDQPPKEKTQQEVAMDLFYKEKFTEMELDFLKEAPDTAFHGSWKIINSDGTIDIDFVPCSVRPEVLYCCYGKN